MLNIDDLEKKHKIYKQKLYSPYIKISALIMIVSIISVLLIDFNSSRTKDLDIQTNSQEENIVKKQNIQNIQHKSVIKENNNTTDSTVKEVVIKKDINTTDDIKSLPEATTQKIEQEQKKVFLTPALNFIDDIKIQKKSNKVDKQEIKSEIKKMQIPLHVEEKRDSISIKRKNNSDDITEVIQRFNVNQNPSLGLFIAQKYYTLGDYKQSYNYALKTNEIDNNIEESWIIFTKSLVKMKQKDLAIQTLKKYINYSNSTQAKELLNKILSGKFK